MLCSRLCLRKVFFNLPTGSCIKKKNFFFLHELVFQEAKKEEEIKVKALIYRDVDPYTANICWKGEKDELARAVQVDTSLLLASRPLWDRDPTPMESVTPTQRLQVRPPRWLTAQMLITGCKQCPRLTHNLTSDIHSSAGALGNRAARSHTCHLLSSHCSPFPPASQFGAADDIKHDTTFTLHSVFQDP